MVCHMKTTLNIPDRIYRALKRRAAERGQTVSSLVAEYLRRGLAERETPARPPPLPSFSVGEPLVDLNDRDALFRVFDEERYGRSYERLLGKRPPE